MAMILDPFQKDAHLKHFWEKTLHAEAIKSAEFKECHVKLYGQHGAPLSSKKKQAMQKQNILL
ncbi:hypothetical protein BDR04DRAFT_1158764 [Suillus decipiens]|nr:hypothetical protein BDR04DRAFT_1158764 [Suillus decipiens]